MLGACSLMVFVVMVPLLTVKVQAKRAFAGIEVDQSKAFIKADALNETFGRVPRSWTRYTPFAKDALENLKLAQAELDKHEKNFKLLPGERLERAFKLGRDSIMLSNKRYIFIDANALSSKVVYMTICYSSILAFKFETAGTFDGDSEMILYTNVLEKSMMHILFKKGEVNIYDLQSFFTEKVLGSKALEKAQEASRAETSTATRSSKSRSRSRGTRSSSRSKNNPDGKSNESSSSGSSRRRRGSGASSSGRRTKSRSRSSLIESQQDPFGRFSAYLNQQGVEADPLEIEGMLRDENTPILMNEEKVEVAFKLGSDSMVFTNKRIIIIDKKGWTGKQIEYQSILYCSIAAYGLVTEGGLFSGDKDSELQFWTNIPVESMLFFEKPIRKGFGDINKVQIVMSKYALGGSNEQEQSSLIEARKESLSNISNSTRVGSHKPGGILSYFGDEAVQISAQTAENQLEANAQFLVRGEKVKLAFKVKKDMTLMTTHRMIFVEAMNGSKVSYKSIPYSHIMGYAIETAGRNDDDAELKLWTDMIPDPEVPKRPPLKKCPKPEPGATPAPCPKKFVRPYVRKPGLAYIEESLKKGYADIFAIQVLLSEKILGGNRPGAVNAYVELSSSAEKSDEKGPFGDLVGYLGGDFKQVKPSSVESSLRTSQPVLLDDETVGLAFKRGYDITVLTSKRLLLIDKKGKGQSVASVEYKTIPFKNIRAYAVESAGVKWNSDAEIEVFTNFKWPLSGGPYTCTKKRRCSKSFLATKSNAEDFVFHQDLQQSGTNLTQIQKFLSQKILSQAHESSLLESSIHGADPNAWLNGAHSEVDRDAALQALMQEIDPFIEEEELVKAYQVGRDFIYVTNMRLLIKDRQGLFGKKTEYQSIPFRSIRSLSMTSAGGFLDVDGELLLETDALAIRSLEKSFHKSKSNLSEVYDKIVTGTWLNL